MVVETAVELAQLGEGCRSKLGMCPSLAEPVSGGFPRIGTSNSEAIPLNLKNKIE